MMQQNDQHALTIAERNAIQALKMVVGDDAIEAVLSRFRGLRMAWDLLVPPDAHKGDPRKAHETLKQNQPDVLKAWAGEVRKPTDAEIKAGDGTNKVVVLGWHQFSTAFHAGKATLAELAQQIETVNGLLDKYAAGKGKVEPIKVGPMDRAVSNASEALAETFAKVEELSELASGLRAAVQGLTEELGIARRDAADARALAGALASRLEAAERAATAPRPPNGQPVAP